MRHTWAENVVLVDYDGVVTDFTQAFDLFMYELGYEVISDDKYDLFSRYEILHSELADLLHEFVHSEEMSSLPPMKGSVKAIKNLRKEGYIFHCITAVPEIQRKNRIKNAESLYGVGVFQRLHCVGLDETKDDILKFYKDTGCIWVEDKPENAELGLKYGLKPYLMHQPYNRTYSHPDVPRVSGWDELYSLVKTHRRGDRRPDRQSHPETTL